MSRFAPFLGQIAGPNNGCNFVLSQNKENSAYEIRT